MRKETRSVFAGVSTHSEEGEEEKQIQPTTKVTADLFLSSPTRSLWVCCVMCGKPGSVLCRFTVICPARSWTLRSVCHWTSGTIVWSQWLPAPRLWSYAFSSGRSAPGGRWWRTPWGCRACPGRRWRLGSWTPSGWLSGWTSATETRQVRGTAFHTGLLSTTELLINFCKISSTSAHSKRFYHHAMRLNEIHYM